VDGASIDLDVLRELPTTVHPFALSRLHRPAGLEYPAGRASRAELSRQLGAGDRVGCDCDSAWRWEQRGRRLHLLRRETLPGRFTYTLSVPGEVAIPELGVRLCIGQEPLAPWMFEGRERRVAMDLPVQKGAVLTVRNRLPGDRLRPLGCQYERRLKEVLIDRGIPRARRDRLPLLCVGSRVAWVPGVTIDESYRISDRSSPWVARIVPI
jgi:tRNA(Ile)-lysidine synthetase-like protein